MDGWRKYLGRRYVLKNIWIYLFTLLDNLKSYIKLTPLKTADRIIKTYGIKKKEGKTNLKQKLKTQH